MWDIFSRKAWETCPHLPHESWGNRALPKWGCSSFTAMQQAGHPTCKPVGIWLWMVLRSCTLGTTASLQPPQTHAALSRDFGPFSLCISDKLQCAGPWGICSPRCLPLHQRMGPGTEERSCLSQGKGGHRRLKSPPVLAQIFILEHNLPLFSSQTHKLGSNRNLLSPSLNTHTPNPQKAPCCSQGWKCKCSHPHLSFSCEH